jgi:hypothetical protein
LEPARLGLAGFERARTPFPSRKTPDFEPERGSKFVADNAKTLAALAPYQIPICDIAANEPGAGNDLRPFARDSPESAMLAQFESSPRIPRVARLGGTSRIGQSATTSSLTRLPKVSRKSSEML